MHALAKVKMERSARTVIINLSGASYFMYLSRGSFLLNFA